uniref:Single Ig and TIR domain containing n=1 Tax=Equus caballus TaxID=9796 RepID=A0A9L0SEE7_HORSE
MAGVCDRAPDFLSPSGNQVLWPALGSVVTLNCTAWVVSGPHCPLPSVQWLKDGLVLGNESHYDLHEDSWIKSNLSEVLASSVLGINLTSTDDYGAFTCSIQNASSSSFTLRRAGSAGHVAAVLASLLVLLALLLAALLYVKCRLNVLLWYQDAYGEVEMNDGKLYDAYVSYSDSPEDRKFVNFILKPQLERRRGYKLFLDDRDLLPHAEPSADLLVNLSRCRRLVVVLSDAFLRRAWCSHSFRWVPCGAGVSPGRARPDGAAPQGGPVPAAGAHAPTHLHHVRGPAARPRAPRAAPAAPAPPPGDPAALEARLRGAGAGLWGTPQGKLVRGALCVGPRGRGLRAWCPRRGLFKVLEPVSAMHGVSFGAGCRGLPAFAPLYVLTRQPPHPGPQTPSSDFWKELQLALPRKVQYRTTEGDPQTRLQDDKDPMLIVRGRVPEGRTLDPDLDPDPEGDLGVRGPIFGEPSAPPQASGVSLGEARGSEVDISDLGSRNYSARTDFYCLVSEDDV